MDTGGAAAAPGGASSFRQSVDGRLSHRTLQRGCCSPLQPVPRLRLDPPSGPVRRQPHLASSSAAAVVHAALRAA
eukprot:scaffold7244_cov224-Prasinococcus_capsulatus_cf.AAC.4